MGVSFPILDTVHLSKVDDRFGKISGCPVLFFKFVIQKFAQTFSKWWFVDMLLCPNLRPVSPRAIQQLLW
jgi:hypothetical protein